MKTFIAQNQTGGLRGFGPLGLEGRSASDATNVFVNAISLIVGFLTVIAIIWFVFQFIFGAISWISAGGDPKAIQSAQGKITNAILGLVIVLLALIIVSTVGALLGIDVLDLGGLIGKLRI